jgi:hypothetical protein
MTSPGPREYAYCPELVTDDYGHEVPCGQPAEIVDRITLTCWTAAGVTVEVHVELACVLRHRLTPVADQIVLME